MHVARPVLMLAAALTLAGCLTETEVRERIVVVGGPDTALLAREGVTFKLHFLARFGEDTLRTDRTFVTAGGDSVRFEMARFYVSEIALVDTNGAAHPLAGTHLVNALDSASVARGYAVVEIKALPGTYRGVRFSVGVPFDENHRDAATQALPLGTQSGMFWSWNSGYIFHRVEGKVDSAGSEKSFAFHIGADHRKVQVNLFSLTGANATTFVVERGHAHKPAALGKGAHEPDNHFAVKVAYESLFSSGLNPELPLRPSLNVNERQAHGGALADRVFLNAQSMFVRAEAAPDSAHAH